GASRCDQCSCWLDSSTASASYPGSSAANTSGSPMLPSAAVRSPAAVSIAASMLTVVVLPLVPVTASHGAARGPRSRHASSGSLYTSRPAAAAARGSGWCGGKPGETTSSSAPSNRPGGG